MTGTTTSAVTAASERAERRDLVAAWATRRGRGVIFDFNGTLSDDEPILLHIFAEMFQEHLAWTLTPEYYYRELSGRSDREIVEIAVERFGDADAGLAERLLEERRRRYRELVAESSPITPAAVHLLRRLADARIPVGIVTGAQRSDVDFVLNAIGVTDLIEVIVTEEDVHHGKPHPEGFLTGAARLGLQPADILVFEDSLPGLQAARAAGMRCIAVAGSRDPGDLACEADAVIENLGPDALEFDCGPGQQRCRSTIA